MRTANENVVKLVQAFVPLQEAHVQRQWILAEAQAEYYRQKRLGSTPDQALMFVLMVFWPEWQGVLVRFDPDNGRYAQLPDFAKVLRPLCAGESMSRPPPPELQQARERKAGFKYQTETINRVIAKALLLADGSWWDGKIGSLGELAGYVKDHFDDERYMILRPAVHNILMTYCTPEETRYLWATCYKFEGTYDGEILWQRVGWPMVLEMLEAEGKGHRTFEMLTRMVEKKVGCVRTILPLATDYIWPLQLRKLRRFYPSLLKDQDRGRRIPQDFVEDGA